MILTKYLSKEVLKSQLAILFILLVIFFSQQLINILYSASAGQVPTNLVFSILALAMPTLMQLMLPLSLFIAILLTLGRLYSETEITAMFACGAGQSLLVKLALFLALPTMLFATVNSFYLSPYALKKQAEILSDAKTNPSVNLLSPGQFIKLNNTVIFIDKISNKKLSNVYIFQLEKIKKLPPFISTADQGVVKILDNGDQILHLENAKRIEGEAGKKNFTLAQFDEYEAYLGHKNSNLNDTKDEEMLSFSQLLDNGGLVAFTELNWRLTMIFATPIMALIAIVLCKVNPRQGRFAKTLPALLVYLMYFLLQSSLKSAAESGKINTSVYIPLVNIAFLSLGIYLNLLQTSLLYNWHKRNKQFKRQQQQQKQMELTNNQTNCTANQSEEKNDKKGCKKGGKK